MIQPAPGINNDHMKIICLIIKALVSGFQDKEFLQEVITADEDPDRSVKGIVSTLERNSSKV